MSRKLLILAGYLLLGAGPLLTGGVVSGCSSSQSKETLLPTGSEAPGLSATDQNGQAVSLNELQGQTVVVYFYPKDDTPGCTKEACAFRDAWDRLEAGGITVIGVSADDRESHQEFAEKYELPFSLVPDTDLKWAKAFGVGTTMGMTKRVTFLIGPDGKIAKVYPDVDPAIHADQVLADAEPLSKTGS